MGWKIISVDTDCILKTYLNNLQIIYVDEKILIPISDIDTLIINNYKIRFSGRLLTKLTENNVNVILCDEKQLPTTIIQSLNGKNKSHEVFQKQLQWTKEYKNKCWNWIMKNKCFNQLRLINDKTNINDWLQIVFSPESNFLEKNYESQIANLFFHQVFGQSFKRDSDNLINSLLDYGYTILTTMVVRSCVAKGLNTQIAFFHGSVYSTHPLAYDIVEVFRSVVDYFVIQLFEETILQQYHFLTKELKNLFLDYISNIKVLIDNKKIFLNNAIDIVCDWIIKEDFEQHEIDALDLLINETQKGELNE